ncbi:MAG: helix-turn-helix domain-containing protein [Ruminococcus sp.]|nr:helix-turn-helix domain-containing protein [Ruminococcus sp.]
MDFYSQLRQRMIDTMQISLRRIRQVIGLGVQEFSDVVGITRQSLNNLESLKVKMSAIQFVAVCAVIDHFVESQPELMSVIISILNSNDTLYDNCVY